MVVHQKDNNNKNKKAVPHKAKEVAGSQRSRKHKLRKDCKNFRGHGNRSYTIDVYYFEMAMSLGAVYLQKSSKNEAGFSRALENKVDIENRDDSTYRDSLKIVDEVFRRGPNNTKLPSKPGSTFGWKMWLTKFDNEELGAASGDHTHQRRQWIRHVVEELNRLGADPNEYSIYTKFQLAGDLTVGQGLPLATYLLTNDVIEVFKSYCLPENASEETIFEVLEEYGEDLFREHRGESIVDCYRKCLTACGIDVFDTRYDDIIHHMHLNGMRDGTEN